MIQNIFVDGLMVKSMSYEINTDGTYSIKYIGVDDSHNQVQITYPRVKIKWYQPARQNYYKLPIVDSLKVLANFNYNVK